MQQDRAERRFSLRCATKVFASWSLLLAGSAASADDGLVLIEAESFQELGGWVVDQQFMDQMGSPFVLAHGLGVPVGDSRTQVDVPSAGAYRVWVRTRDWVAPWKAPGAPGRFQVLVDGRPLATTFGVERADWHWQDGGLAEIGPSTTIGLRDVTGFEGRCDAILLAADQSFVPPDGGEKLEKLRRKMLGWDRGPEDGGEFDLVIVGGGIAGTSAAVTAARLGLTVALVQDRPVLGGNGSSEVRVWPQGFTNHEPYPRIGDVVVELIGPHRPARSIPDIKSHTIFTDRRMLELAQAEPNLTLCLERRVNAADSRDGSVHAVIAQHTRTGRRTRITGRWFLDSTGDGVLGALVRADYELAETGRMGATNLWSFGETGENEHALQCLCEDFHEKIALNFTPADKPQPFPRCPWAADLKDVDFPGRNREKTFGATGEKQLGTWFWETGFNRDPFVDGEWIRDQNFRAMYGAWDVLKNVDGRYPNHRLKWAAFIAGKRESRRLMGDVVLTADDFRKATPFPDAAFPCTWHIDVHSPHPDYFEKDDPDAFFSTYTRGKDYQYKQPYWAPYRCLYSRNIDNLFMAGRDISVTQDGLGAVRVMRTCGMMGEVVAMAAAVCKEHDCTPRDVYELHLADLQRHMRDGAGQAASDEPAE
ncbi:MAG: FAD-dependent oxidoreductase [Planctomycetota bacterium]